MATKEHVAEALTGLDERDLEQVAEYVAFLKFRARLRAVSRPDTGQLAQAYAEFADEDRALAEEGLSEYAASLAEEDAS